MTPSEDDDRIEAPTKRDDVVFRPLERTWVLYDPKSGLLHELNSVAALTWVALDGERSPSNIVSEIEQLMDDTPGPETILADVLDVLSSFKEKGLLA